MKRFTLLLSSFLLGGMLNAQIDFTLSPHSGDIDGARISSTVFADVNGDNALDLIMAGDRENGGATGLFINDGTGAFTETTGTPFPTLFQAAIDTADVNGNGHIDLIITGRNMAG